MQIEAIVFLVIIVLAFGGAGFWLWRQNGANRQAMEALAARTGWSIAHRLPTGGRAETWTVTPKDDNWELVVSRHRGQGSEVRTTQWQDSSVRRPQGVVAIGPELAADDAAMAGALLGSLDSPMGQALMSAAFGFDAGEMAGLRPLAGAPAGATVMATDGSASGLDVEAITAAMREWSGSQKGRLAQPVVIHGNDGLRVRLRDAITRPEGIQAFVDFALRVRALTKAASTRG